MSPTRDILYSPFSSFSKFLGCVRILQPGFSLDLLNCDGPIIENGHCLRLIIHSITNLPLRAHIAFEDLHILAMFLFLGKAQGRNSVSSKLGIGVNLSVDGVLP